MSDAEVRRYRDTEQERRHREMLMTLEEIGANIDSIARALNVIAAKLLQLGKLQP